MAILSPLLVNFLYSNLPEYGEISMKTKVCKVTPLKLFLVFFALFMVVGVTAFAQEDTLRGTWFNEWYLMELTFYDGSFEVVIYARPNHRGEYAVAGNKLTRKPTAFHSNTIGSEESFRWYSQDEAITEFGSWIASWFEPYTHTFSINGNILTLVDLFDEERQFTRVR